MTTRLTRRCADLACRGLQRTLPPELETWGWAVRSEVAEIPNDAEALRYALGSCCGFLPRVILARLSPDSTDGLSSDIRGAGAMVGSPRSIGVACAVGAVLIGLAYMAAAGAPARYLVVNGAALLIGFVMLVIAQRVTLERWGSAMTLACSGILLATALLGEQVDGAARWVRLGTLAVQPSLVLLPVMIVAFARARDALSAGAMVVAAAGLAIQPDRAMAGVLAVAAAGLALRRPDRFALTALAGSIAGFAAALAQADALPAVPYVDQILYSSFEVHPLAGAAVLAGLGLLIVPGIVGWLGDRANRDVYLALGTIWLGAVLAAALGNYPTPLVGYGGSAIVGYVLCLALLPKRVASSLAADTERRENDDAPSIGNDLRVGLPTSAA